VKGIGPSRRAIIVGVAFTLLAGCAVAQPAIGAPGAMSLSRAIVTPADRSGSWMAK
jgi:hypothetical protein